jgi:hypothetical protein
MHRTASLPVLVVALCLAGCSEPPAPAPAPVTVTVQAPPPPPPATLVATATPPPDPSPSTWTMPNLVGSNLQEAQNAIQSLTDFEVPVTLSHDETGAGRQQVVDRNWKVCSQNVAAGETITSSTRIDFGAVKVEESC